MKATPVIEPGRYRHFFTSSQESALRDMLERHSGLLVSSRKTNDIVTKLRPLLSNFDTGQAFLDALSKSDSLKSSVINRVTIGETYFFRNAPHFDALRQRIIPDIVQNNADKKSMSIWSAGCATGEEAYSLSILLHREFPHLRHWNISILGTDINTDALAKAKRGEYTPWSFRGVPDELRNEYFDAVSPNCFRVKDTIRSSVSFRRLNLAHIQYSDNNHPLSDENTPDKVDLILCRNVLIYFSSQLANATTCALSERLVPGGYMLLGHSESFPEIHQVDTIYAHATYYYRKMNCSDDTAHVPASHSPTLVPGIGCYDTDKMFTHHGSPASLDEFLNSPSEIENRFSAPPIPIDPVDSQLILSVEEDLRRARDYTMDGHLDDARFLLEKLETTGEHLDYRVYFLKAMVHDQRNELEESLHCLKQCIFINKTFIVGHYYQGIICERRGDIDLAKRSYKNASHLAQKLPADEELQEGGGITASRLHEIATERIKELTRRP